MFQALPQLKLLASESARAASHQGHDATVVIFNDAAKLASASKALGGAFEAASSQIDSLLAVDQHASKEAQFIPAANVPGGKLIFSSTGPLTRDYDDVRRYGEAAAKAVSRAKSAGTIKNPLVFIQPPPFECMEEEVAQQFSRYIEVTLLSLLAEQHEPLEARETLPDLLAKSINSFTAVPIDCDVQQSQLDAIISWVSAVESGRRLARDIGGADPERMTSLKAAATIKEFFSNQTGISVAIQDELDVIKKDYPLLAAVARASSHVPRHLPAVVHLTYRSPQQDKVQKELFMVGKGINYDTGGADIKHGGAMMGMSRDKCGAAALAGFMATVAALQPTNLNIDVTLAFARNSIGSDAYVSDEIIKSRAGVRVRIGNTDAEGRMVMADLLAEMKEKALASNSINPHLFTCATLTGHVLRAYGPYAAAMDNGPARLLKIGESLKANGQLIGDCFETSTLRRDDFSFVAPHSACEDVIQANNLPSTMTNRGHQYPAAFLTIASGLDKHGLDAPKEKRLPYTHLDIAGSACDKDPWGRVTGSPIPALAATFLK